LAVPSDHPAVVDMLHSCPHLTSLAAPSAFSVVAALATGFPRAAGFDAGATFGAGLHTLQLMTGPNTDMELDALLAGLPQLRALALGDCNDLVTVEAWRRNLLLLLGRLEVLEFGDAGPSAFSALNALAGPDPGAAAAASPSCLVDLPTLPLRAFALASQYNVDGDAAAFIAAVGQRQAQSHGSDGLVELRLSEVTPETWLAAPATVTHLRLNAPHLDEPQLAAVLDGARLPRLRVLESSCHAIFPFDVVYRNAPLAPAVARSPLKEVSHPMLRRLVLECADTSAARAAAREAWAVAILGPSEPTGVADGPVRFPRLQHVVMNGVALRGWPSHDPFVPALQPAEPRGILYRASLAWVVRR
jgi:hypothetical protein